MSNRRTAVVTGASRGIGLAIARRLCAEGTRTILLARTRAALDEAARELGGLAIPVTCDIADREQVENAVHHVEELCNGAPDVLVNNAGLFPLAPIAETSVNEFASAVQVNLVAPFHFMRAFLPAMLERRSGHIVLIGSVADRTVYPANAAYAATKFGARAMHEVLRMETRGTGVRSSLVSPSPVDTNMWDAVNPDQREGFTPRSDMLRAEDVADAVMWVLLQPESVNIDEMRLSRS